MSFQWIILGLLVVSHAELGALLNPARLSGNPSDDPLVAFALGFLLSQPLLCAFWTAFAPQRFYHRLLWGLLLCASVAFSAEAGNLLLGARTDSFRAACFARGFFLSMDMILFLLATPLLLLTRRLSGWKLARPTAEPVASDYQPHQFGVKHLLILTAIAALVCGLFRTVSVIDPTVSVQPIAEVAQAVLQIAFALMPVGLIPWIALGCHKGKLATALWAIVVLGISGAGCDLLLPVKQDPGLIHIILLIQLGAGSSTFITTLVIRCCGFRATGRNAEKQ